MTHEAIDIRPIDLLDPEQDAQARAWIGVHEAAQHELFGDAGSTWTLEEIRAFHRAGQKRRVVRGAWVDGELLGSLEVIMPLLDNESLAMVWLSVEPEARRRGIGSALFAEAERVATDHGRTILLVETEWAAGRHDESESFARRHGFELGQTVLRSCMSLDVDRARLRAMVDGDGAEDYELESFVDLMPEEWLEDRAVLQQRMSTDAPSGDLDLEEEAWDAERLRSDNARWRDAGRRVVETAARHRPTGRLVGFTQISISAEEPTLGYQQDTLVLSEHRGHALGLRLKAANALRVLDAVPAVTAIRTWNAEGNAPMLAVNRALGYAVDGYSREWQKVLPA